MLIWHLSEINLNWNTKITKAEIKNKTDKNWNKTEIVKAKWIKNKQTKNKNDKSTTQLLKLKPKLKWKLINSKHYYNGL